MKNLAILFICMLSVVSYSQSDDCGSLPRVKVDQKAEMETDLVKLISKDMPASLKKDGEHSAVFKMYIDCHGEVAKHKYERGTLSESDQKWILKIVGKTTWSAAVFEKKNVTSTVFVTVNINNGQIKVVTQ